VKQIQYQPYFFIFFQNFVFFVCFPEVFAKTIDTNTNSATWIFFLSFFLNEMIKLNNL